MKIVNGFYPSNIFTKKLYRSSWIGFKVKDETVVIFGKTTNFTIQISENLSKPRDATLHKK